MFCAYAGEASLSAEYDGAELARLMVVPFKLQTRTLLVVNVNSALRNTNRSGITDGLNDIYKQCVTEFSLLGTISFTYSTPPVNNVWTRQDLNNLCAAAANDAAIGCLVRVADHVVFIVPGEDIDSSAFGRGSRPGKYVWLYSHFISSHIVAHEIGHNFNLHDEYTFVSNGQSIAGPDRDNVMNQVGAGSGTRFRYHQWNKVNKNLQ